MSTSIGHNDLGHWQLHRQARHRHTVKTTVDAFAGQRLDTTNLRTFVGNVNQYFRTVRDRGGVRQEITVYSLRHLWISEMLMEGVDVLLVARMAGTSVKMIETVYGHFRTQSYSDAQARLDLARAGRGMERRRKEVHPL